jgi:ribosomal protein S18 acetylase RimI-like enzyme
MIVTSLGASPIVSNISVADGLRPVNLRTDLRPLADLIEIVFADAMDEGGRAAIREMRYLSHMGYGLNLISRLNDLALGMSLGHVYIADGKLVGNVSIYPAGYPKGMGSAWIIANVGVHPDYQRRGIARQLLEASLDMIRERRGKHAILQVNYDNMGAQRLYAGLGFVYERAWRTWRRSSFIKQPPPTSYTHHITRLRTSEWQSEYRLAQRTRPNQRGGLGWLTPLHKSYFYTPWWKRLSDVFAMRNIEKLIIRDDVQGDLVASMWLESAMNTTSLRTRLLIDVDEQQRSYADALLNNVLRRFARSTVLMEHPSDDTQVNDLLTSYEFKVMRDLWHMRLDL